MICTKVTNIDKGYEDLANAIIIQVTNEYRELLKKLEQYPFDECLLIEKAKCEQFFISDWYKSLTTVDGTMILRKLQRGE